MPLLDVPDVGIVHRSCERQPGYTDRRKNNARFRIPLQLYGLGILDGIQDREILARHDASATLREELGIQGIPNRGGNDGTLWGVGQRMFFLHDGRTNDLMQAIRAHQSSGSDCEEDSRRAGGCYGPSEANTVIQRFNSLSAQEKQAILDFLRSL